MRIDAHQFAIVIGIAIAGTRRPRLDVTHHWTGIAADLVGGTGRISQHEQALQASVKLSNGEVDSDARYRNLVVSIAGAEAIRAFCLYTNDLARERETCQALSRPKTAAAA
jgi:hypothetical protein